MSSIVAVKFKVTDRTYHFHDNGIKDLQPGDHVVVHTSRGRQLAVVSGYVDDVALKGRSCKPIERRATPRDLVSQQRYDTRAFSTLEICRQLAEDKLPEGTKIIRAEFAFDGSQVTFVYTSDNRKLDFSQLQRDLQRKLRIRVEFFHAGARDHAKMLDGLGACGEHRCCSRFLTRFVPISIRMAKTQNVSLNPAEITGVCGRLRCCLAYETDFYAEAAKQLPKKGKEIVSPYGSGKVIETRILANQVVINVEGKRHVVKAEDIGKTEFSHTVELETDWPEWFPAEPEEEKSKETKKKTQAPRKRSQRSKRRKRHAKPSAKTDPRSKSTNTQKRKRQRPRRPKSGKQSS